MGTNYYAHFACCPTCGKAERVTHIGKSSAGWCFGLHVYPRQGISDLDDWRKEFERCVIRDEYGVQVAADEMVRIITERSHGRPWSDDLLRQNHAVRGPNNLARHAYAPMLHHHGAGTWDALVGDDETAHW